MTRQRWVVGLALVALVAGCGECQKGETPGEDAGARAPDAGAPKVIAEQEPNNSVEQATLYTQRSKAPGSPLVLPFEGELSKGTDVDFVEIPAAKDGAPRVLRLEPLGEADVALVWGGASDAVTDRAGVGEAEVVSHLTAARVVVAVRGGVEGGAAPLKYRLTLERQASASGGVAIEAGPGEEAPTRVDAPGEAQGVIQYRGDVDEFVVDLAGLSGEGARVEVMAPAGLGLEAELTLDGEPVATLTAPRAEETGEEGGDAGDAGAEERDAGARAVPSRAVFPNLAVPDGAKALNVKVKGLGDAPGWRAGYTVRVLPMPPAPKGTMWELEGRELMGIREPGVVSGFLHAPDDEDAFNLTIPEVEQGEPPYVLTATLAGEAVDWVLRVTTPGDERPRRTVMADAEAGEAEVVCRQAVEAGPVRLEVAAAEGGEVDGAYRLEVRWRQAVGEEVEPNGSVKSASELKLGAKTRAVAFPRGDVDLFSFMVTKPDAAKGSRGDEGAEPEPDVELRRLEREPAGTSGGLTKVLPRIGDGPPTGDREPREEDEPGGEGVSIELRAVGELVNPVLVVLDPDGVELARSDRRGVGEEEVIRVDDLWAGLYFVRVEMGKGTEASCDAVYTLRARAVGR